MNLERFRLLQTCCLLVMILSACINQPIEPVHEEEVPDPIVHTQAPKTASPQESSLEGVQAATATLPSDLPHTDPTLYQLEVEFDYTAKTLAVNQIITYANNTGLSLDHVPLLVPPAFRAGVFILNAIQSEPPGAVVETPFDNSRIDLVMDQPLMPGQEIRIDLKYQLRLPMGSLPLGYTDRQVLLTDWYPLIPPHQDENGWMINPPGLVGEHLVYPLSDFSVNFCLAANHDELHVAASAPVIDKKDGCYQYRVQDKRNITLAISPDYQLETAIDEQVTVMVYTFPEHNRLGKRAAELAITAWGTFTDLYGPNERDILTIVEADIFDGLETDGLIFLSEWYFQTADPSPKNYFELLIVHETVHQWLYGFVHNDQAHEPWLDEALSTFSEIIYYEIHHPQLVDWWWDYRVNTYAPQGPVNATIYEINQYRPYINAVYLRGASFLQAVRIEVGETAFIQAIQDYIQTDDTMDRLRTSDDFFAAFSGVSDAELTNIIAEYFD